MGWGRENFLIKNNVFHLYTNKATVMEYILVLAFNPCYTRVYTHCSSICYSNNAVKVQLSFPLYFKLSTAFY